MAEVKWMESRDSELQILSHRVLSIQEEIISLCSAPEDTPDLYIGYKLGSIESNLSELKHSIFNLQERAREEDISNPR